MAGIWRNGAPNANRKRPLRGSPFDELRANGVRELGANGVCMLGANGVCMLGANGPGMSRFAPVDPGDMPQAPRAALAPASFGRRPPGAVLEVT